MLDKMKSNTYVKCYWSDVIQHMDDDNANVVLDMVIDLWITIREYPYQSSK